MRAPARINIIGEHTDYNGGFVLPAAIDKAIWLAVSRRTDEKFAFHALDLADAYVSEDAATVRQTKHSWANYLLGVISEARKDGLHIGGLNIVFSGDVPLGAGLSSSAALESGVMFAINELYQLGLNRMDIVRLAQRGENNFVGMKCGIMDMFASVMGRENHVIRLDCRSLEYAYFPFFAEDYTFILVDSCVKHNLVDSEYNRRREDCELGVSILRVHYPDILTLRDVSAAILQKHQEELPSLIFTRCKYVVEENERVALACQALQQNDFEVLGQLMFETHNGLRTEYEVSVPELDFLVGQAQQLGVVGARMMGGGFGGCSLNLVKKELVDYFLTRISDVYLQQFGIELKAYRVDLTDGTSVV